MAYIVSFYVFVCFIVLFDEFYYDETMVCDLRVFKPMAINKTKKVGHSIDCLVFVFLYTYVC